MHFLSYDSKFGQIMNKLCCGCYLNLLWFICSLPIVTIGASTTALYYVSFKLARDEGSSVTAMFFRSFKQNFKQATVIWLILLAVGLFLGLDGYVLYHLRASATGPAAAVWTILLAVVIAAAILYAIELAYVFPLLSYVSNTTGAMIRNAFLIGARYLFCTLLVFAIHYAMFFLVVNVFTPLILFGEGLCAVISAHLLIKVIAPLAYDPNAPAKEDDEKSAETDDGETPPAGGDA